MALDQRIDRDFVSAARWSIAFSPGASAARCASTASRSPRSRRAATRSARAARRRCTSASIPPRAPLWDDETLARLVAAVRGRAAADTIGPAAQQAVGRLFNKTYVGDAESFRGREGSR